MALSGVSTLGVTFGYGVETTAGTKPSAFSELSRINSIGGINLSQESIDSSAISDLVSQSVEGRSDPGGEWTVTVNATDETIAEWTAIKGTTKWFEVYHPSMTKAWFIAAAVPASLPLPEIGQNELLTMEVSLVIKTYHGLDTKVTPTAPL